MHQSDYFSQILPTHKHHPVVVLVSYIYFHPYKFRIVGSAFEGTTIQRLYNSIILGTPIDLPSIPEQKRIVETLSSFDEYIDNLAELIEKKKNIRDGALEDLVTGKTRLDGYDKD